MLVGAYCVAFLITVCVPEIKYNQQMGAEFSKLMTLVVGFYFVTHKERATNADRQVQQDTCQDCERGKTDVL